MRRQNSTPNLVKICSAVLQLVRGHGGDIRCIWNTSLQLHKRVGDNNRFTVTFCSRIADVTVRILIYVVNCLQIVYILPHIPFKYRKTFILFWKSTYDVEQWQNIGDNNRFTVTFCSRIAYVTVRILIYVVNCLQIVYTLPLIPFKYPKTFILFGKSTYYV
jgi:hypothetical protein